MARPNHTRNHELQPPSAGNKDARDPNGDNHIDQGGIVADGLGKRALRSSAAAPALMSKGGMAYPVVMTRAAPVQREFNRSEPLNIVRATGSNPDACPARDSVFRRTVERIFRSLKSDQAWLERYVSDTVNANNSCETWRRRSNSRTTTFRPRHRSSLPTLNGR